MSVFPENLHPPPITSLSTPGEPAILAGKHQLLETSLVLSSAVILLYDYLITWDLEVALVWLYPPGWSITSLLFMLARYLPFVDTINVLWHQLSPGITPASCELSFRATGWMYLIGIAITEVILAIRTWAVWGRDRRMTIALPLFFVAIWIPNFVIMGFFLDSLVFEPAPYPEYRGCNIVHGSKILFATWVMLMVYEAVILGLMMYRGYISYCNGGNSALFNVVYRDGALYYLYLFAVSLVNILVINLIPVGTFRACRVDLD
ncbi:hypothetical protein HGRIS_005211 [Hohenbuehelia grisea]|uniref:DUF6533 domain-containing protein n=1 Tax=Hohenbuehelia grisea TaxID=104357 RepID=A0ABR3JEB1_9AGAR